MPTQLPLLNLSLPDGQRFENFYTSSTNELLLKELKSSINNTVDKDREHKQIFIWGTKDTGKSHLLQACCHQAFAHKKLAVYIPLSNMNHHGIDIFTGLSSYQLICLDDIDTVLAKDTWELALFNLINQARENQQILILSANENPRHSQCKLADLQSRLLWGASYQIHALNDNEKKVAIRYRARQRGIDLENQVIEYIYKRYPRDFTTLIEILNKLDKESLTSKRRITKQLVKQALESLTLEPTIEG
jgi:DnaA family protein